MTHLQTSLLPIIISDASAEDKFKSVKDIHSEMFQKNEVEIAENIAGTQDQFELQLIDVLNMQCIQNEIDKGGKNELIKLVKMLFQDDLLSYAALIKNLEESILQDCGLLYTKSIKVEKAMKGFLPPLDMVDADSKKNNCLKVPDIQYYTRYNKILSQKYQFEQDKFNLQREENEGYAKLVTYLVQPGVIDYTDEQVDKLNENVNKLIGYFNLDPHRVLDLILEAMENQVFNIIDEKSNKKPAQHPIDISQLDKVQGVFIKLIKFQSSPTKISQNVSALLGLKLSYILHTMAKDCNTKDIKQVIPFSLLVLVAVLIKYDVITPEDIWPYLLKQEKLVDTKNKTVQYKISEKDDVEYYHREYQQVLDQKYQSLDVNVIDQDYKIQQQLRWDNKMKELHTLRDKSLNLDFQLWLVACLLKVNDLQDAQFIIEAIWGEQNFDMTIHREIQQSMFTLMDLSVDYLSKNLSSSPNVKKTKSRYQILDADPKGITTSRTPEELLQNLQKIFQFIGVHIGLDPLLFLKVIQVFNVHLIQSTTISDTTRNHAISIAGQYLLPALCIVRDSNPVLDSEMWQIMKTIDPTQRYLAYQQLLCKHYLTNFTMLGKVIEMTPKVVKWVKCLSEDKKQIEIMRKDGNRLANGANTLIFGDQIIYVCTNFSNLIKPMIHSMEKGTFKDLALDMMAYSILRNLSEKQDKYRLIDQDANPDPILKNLIEFTSLFFKTFPHVDLKPMISYVLNRMKNGNNYYESFILSSLLTSMFGWKNLEVSLQNEQQMQSLAGGMWLKVEMLGLFSEFKKTRKSCDALNQLFYEDVYSQNADQKVVNLSFALRLMCHVAQQNQHVINDLDNSGIEPVQNLYDRMQEIFTQLVDTIFLLTQSHQKYRQLFPPKEHISEIFSLQYRLNYQHTYAILRKSFKPIYEMNKVEFDDLTNLYVEIFEKQFHLKMELCPPQVEESDGIEDYPYWDEQKFIKNKFESNCKWQNFDKHVFTLFWQLELQDISVPNDVYTEKIKQKDQEIKRLQNDKNGNKRDLDQMIDVSQTLKNELEKRQKTNNSKIMSYLRENLAAYFENIPDQQGISEFFTQYCIYPRLMFSPADALFSIKFLKMLIELRVPKINALHIFDRILSRIIPTVHCCTGNESENLGIFFMEWFQMIDRWTQGNGDIFNKECSDYHAFDKVIAQGSEGQIIDYNYYQRIVVSIHKRFAQFLQVCLKNPIAQHTKTKCALKILSRLRDVFPISYLQAKAIHEELDKINKMGTELEKDIRVLCLQYEKVLTDKFKKLKEKPEEVELAVKDDYPSSSTDKKKRETKQDDKEQVKKQQQPQQSNSGNTSREVKKAQPTKDSQNQKMQSSSPNSNPRRTNYDSRKPSPNRRSRSPRARQPRGGDAQKHPASAQRQGDTGGRQQLQNPPPQQWTSNKRQNEDFHQNPQAPKQRRYSYENQDSTQWQGGRGGGNTRQGTNNQYSNQGRGERGEREYGNKYNNNNGRK